MQLDHYVNKVVRCTRRTCTNLSSGEPHPRLQGPSPIDRHWKCHPRNTYPQITHTSTSIAHGKHLGPAFVTREEPPTTLYKYQKPHSPSPPSSSPSHSVPSHHSMVDRIHYSKDYDNYPHHDCNRKGDNPDPRSCTDGFVMVDRRKIEGPRSGSVLMRRFVGGFVRCVLGRGGGGGLC